MWFIIIIYVYYLAVYACGVIFTPYYFRLLTELVAVYSKLCELKYNSVA